MKKINRSRILAILIMLIMMFAVACGQTEEETADSKNQDTSNEQNEQSTDDVEEPGDDEPADVEGPGNGEDSVDSDDEAADALTVEGTFGGLADPHTFELKTDEAAEGVMAFQFYDEEIGEKLADMESGQALTVVYTTNEHGQNLVESIE